MSILTIGQVAKAANVNIETIRYYQRRGLLPEPVKPLGRHRRHSDQDVSRLQFIKRAQALGFTLEEVNNLLRLERSKCRRAIRKATARLFSH
jgi:MerR family mercuric resistance operon transcriptional regulator